MPVEAKAALRVEILTIFPEVIDAYCRRASSGGPGGRVSSTCACTTSAWRRPIRTAVWTTHLSEAVPAWCSPPSPCSGPSSWSIHLGPCTCSHRAVAASTRRSQPSSRASALARAGHDRAAFSLLCGRYEGVDQRISEHLIDGELSVGDFVLAGGARRSGRGRGHGRASCPGSSATRPPRVTRASPPGCWSTRSTRDLLCSGAGRCRKSCVEAITAVSSGGVGPPRSGARSSSGRT